MLKYVQANMFVAAAKYGTVADAWVIISAGPI